MICCDNILNNRCLILFFIFFLFVFCYLRCLKKKKPNYCLITARSISEEFSSGDTKNRDSDDAMQPTSGHNKDPKSPKDKDDKERGDEGTISFFF